MLNWILFTAFLLQYFGDTVGLNQVDVTTACSVSNCMSWCGCQNSHDLTQIQNLRHQCQIHYSTTYTDAVRCPDKRLCLCKENNDNCKTCTKDASNDLMCFKQIMPSREVSICKNGRCETMPKICGTMCLGCMRPSTTAYPSTRGQSNHRPTRRPPSGTHLPKITGEGSNLGNHERTSLHPGHAGNDGYNQGPGSDSNVFPQEENQTAKIIAIITCTVMLLISISVFIVVLVKLKQQNDSGNQPDNLKENGYATIPVRKRSLMHIFTAKSHLRDKLFDNQVYDDSFTVDSNRQQISAGPPIPMSDRPFKKAIINGSRVYPPVAVKPPLRHVQPACADINDEIPVDSREDGQLLVDSSRNPSKDVKTEYMSLMKSRKPLPPWKGPHGERYNLEGYTELNNAVLNKSNNASTNYQDISPRRTVSVSSLAPHREPECSTRSLPNTVYPVDKIFQYPTFNTDDNLDQENGYYYKIKVDNHADGSDWEDTVAEDGVSPYYYSLQEGGDVAVTSIHNTGSETYNTIESDIESSYDGDVASENVQEDDGCVAECSV